MKVKTISSSKIFNPFTQQISNLEPEYNGIMPQYSQNDIEVYSSPILSYFKTSNQYLIRKYSEDHNIIDMEKSSNFIRKDFYYLNEQNNSNSSKETNSNENSIDNNQINTNINLINDMQIQNNLSNNNFQNKINKGNNKNKGKSNNTMMMINNNFPIFSQNNNSNKNLEMFGKKGWICNYCNNFNYENRSKCNRCKIGKNNQKNKNQQKINVNFEKKNTQISNQNNQNNLLLKQKFSERVGDWFCFKCKNLNFSFRTICNRCQLSKEDSDNYFQYFYDNLQNQNLNNQLIYNNNNTTKQIFNNPNIFVVENNSKNDDLNIN